MSLTTCQLVKVLESHRAIDGHRIPLRTDPYDPFDRPPGEVVPDRHAGSNNEETREAETPDDHDPAFEPDRYWDLSGSSAVEVEFTPDGTPIREDGNPIRSRRRR